MSFRPKFLGDITVKRCGRSSGCDGTGVTYPQTLLEYLGVVEVKLQILEFPVERRGGLGLLRGLSAI